MCHWGKEKLFCFQFAEPPAYRAPPKPLQVVPESGHREQELLKQREKHTGLNSCLLTSLAHGPSALTDLYRYMSFFSLQRPALHGTSLRNKWCVVEKRNSFLDACWKSGDYQI